MFSTNDSLNVYETNSFSLSLHFDQNTVVRFQTTWINLGTHRLHVTAIV